MSIASTCTRSDSGTTTYDGRPPLLATTVPARTVRPGSSRTSPAATSSPVRSPIVLRLRPRSDVSLLRAVGPCTWT